MSPSLLLMLLPLLLLLTLSPHKEAPSVPSDMEAKGGERELQPQLLLLLLRAQQLLRLLLLLEPSLLLRPLLLLLLLLLLLQEEEEEEETVEADKLREPAEGDLFSTAPAPMTSSACFLPALLPLPATALAAGARLPLPIIWVVAPQTPPLLLWRRARRARRALARATAEEGEGTIRAGREAPLALPLTVFLLLLEPHC